MKLSALFLSAALALAGGPATACQLPGNAAALLQSAGQAMNAQRSAQGRGQLARNPALDKAAQAHACWMGDTGTFSHKGRGGSTPKTRVKSTGYRTMLTAENIAFGQGSGNAVIADWMASSGHRKNILLSGIREYGVGVAMMQGRPVWVMVYANPM